MMDIDYDPNTPDCTNGDFFCRLCLASMNSETMWSSHIAGKRHIKNVQTFPNGLHKRRISDDENSYDRPPKHERIDCDYNYGDNYPPDYDGYYEDEFPKKRPPVDYVPIIKPNVVFDYGHTKKLEDDIPRPLPPPPMPPPAVSKLTPVLLKSKEEETISTSMKLDEILNEITSGAKKSQENDDFFERINQREIAKDIAKELAQKRTFSNKIKVHNKEPQKQSSSSGHEKYSKGKASDIFDILHKHNDKMLFKETDEDDRKSEDLPSRSSSPSKKSLSRKKEKSDLNNFDPDKLTPDVLDDLLSFHLKSKINNSNKSQESEKEKIKQLDDPEVLAEKLNALPTMKILEIFHNKLKNLDLKDSEELKMVLKILGAAQELVCKNLPPDLQAVLNAKMSGSNVKSPEVPSKNVLKSENPASTSVTLSSKSTPVNQNYPTAAPPLQPAAPIVPLLPSIVPPNQTFSVLSQAATNHSQNTVQSVVTSQNPAAVSVTAPVSSTAPSKGQTVPPKGIESLLSNFPGMPPGFRMPPALMNPIQATANQPPRAGGVPNSFASQAAWQNYQMYNYYRMMQYMHANRQTAPSSNANSTIQPPVSKQTEHSNDKSSEQSKSKSSVSSKSMPSQYSKDKSSEYSNSRSSDYLKGKSSEYSKSKYPEYSKNKHSDYTNSKSFEHSRSKHPEPSRNSQVQSSKSSQPNPPPVAPNLQSRQSSKELLETLKKLQEFSDEFKNSTSAKKDKK